MLLSTPCKNLLTSVLLAWSLLQVHTSRAHGGAKPQHGGIVQSAHDLTFELIPHKQGLALYVRDHGKAVTANGRGTITVLHKGKTQEAALTAAGAYWSATPLAAPKGSTVVAVLMLANPKTVSVRFRVK